MARCPHCEFPIPDDRERVGARCSNCRDPLYEPALRFSRLSREGEASCALHAGMESVSVCARCNQHLCETCRTRWRNVIVCAACADRALSSQEAAPVQSASARQALAGMVMACAAWLLAGLGAAGLGVLSTGSDLGTILTFGSIVLLTGAVPLAAVAVGMAGASLRTSGPFQWLAGTGLLLGGLYIGLLLGLGTLALIQN